MTPGRCACRCKMFQSSWDIISTTQAELIRKHASSNRRNKRLINICSFASVRRSLLGDYQKSTDVVVNIINNKAGFHIKKAFLIAEMRRLHLLHHYSPLWFRTGHKANLNEGALLEFQAHIWNWLIPLQLFANLFLCLTCNFFSWDNYISTSR